MRGRCLTTRFTALKSSCLRFVSRLGTVTTNTLRPATHRQSHHNPSRSCLRIFLQSILSRRIPNHLEEGATQGVILLRDVGRRHQSPYRQKSTSLCSSTKTSKGVIAGTAHAPLAKPQDETMFRPKDHTKQNQPRLPGHQTSQRGQVAP